MGYILVCLFPGQCGGGELDQDDKGGIPNTSYGIILRENYTLPLLIISYMHFST